VHVVFVAVFKPRGHRLQVGAQSVVLPDRSADGFRPIDAEPCLSRCRGLRPGPRMDSPRPRIPGRGRPGHVQTRSGSTHSASVRTSRTQLRKLRPAGRSAHMTVVRRYSSHTDHVTRMWCSTVAGPCCHRQRARWLSSLGGRSLVGRGRPAGLIHGVWTEGHIRDEDARSGDRVSRGGARNDSREWARRAMVDPYSKFPRTN
jgi:hypothetical protein